MSESNHLTCRFCSEKLSKSFVDLGLSPLANSFLDYDAVKVKEAFYPLHAFVCNNCLLVQLEEFESPKNIFTNYVYFSSYSDTWLKHAENYVDTMMKRFKFDRNSLIIEIASNDGYLLQYFKNKNIPILGIEPAENIAIVAKEKGIPTITKFFGLSTAKELKKNSKLSDLIIGNNVLAHVPNLNDFLSGMKVILKPEGIITVEFPHLLKLIQEKQFDTIYHEHFSYFSLLAVQKIFSFHNLTIFDVDELTTHGGSLRIYAKHSENNKLSIDKKVEELLQKEKHFGLDNISTYMNFQHEVDESKKNIQKFFKETKEKGKKIVGYGAPAKANTLLNYCEIGIDFIDYTVDLSPHKQSMYLPGTHIPIKDPAEIKISKPDYLVIFPWNLKNEIMIQTKYINEWGGKFVVLIPEVKIYN